MSNIAINKIKSKALSSIGGSLAKFAAITTKAPSPVVHKTIARMDALFSLVFVMRAFSKEVITKAIAPIG
jgi:hypothetical protein